MKFGKSLRNEIAETVPEWEGEYISYKDLKKQLKLIVNRSSNTTEDICFVQLLYSNLNKFQQFFMDKEEEYIIRLQIRIETYFSESRLRWRCDTSAKESSRLPSRTSFAFTLWCPQLSRIQTDVWSIASQRCGSQQRLNAVASVLAPL
ncbi:hypothetical protein LguiB_008231 [Lonicera macranthoides]